MTDSIQISIPGVKIKYMNVTIEGVTPLLTAAWNPEVMQDIMDAQQGISVAKRPRDPDAEYEASIYRTEDGECGFIAGAVKNAMVAACRFNKIKMTEARGLFFIIGEILPLRIPSSMPVKHKNVMAKLNGRVSTPVYRMKYDVWEMDLTIQYNAGSISEESILNLLEIAGFAVVESSTPVPRLRTKAEQ